MIYKNLKIISRSNYFAPISHQFPSINKTEKDLQLNWICAMCIPSGKIRSIWYRYKIIWSVDTMRCQLSKTKWNGKKLNEAMRCRVVQENFMKHTKHVEYCRKFENTWISQWHHCLRHHSSPLTQSHTRANFNLAGFCWVLQLNTKTTQKVAQCFKENSINNWALMAFTRCATSERGEL